MLAVHGRSLAEKENQRVPRKLPLEVDMDMIFRAPIENKGTFISLCEMAVFTLKPPHIIPGYTGAQLLLKAQAQHPNFICKSLLFPG